MHRATSENIFVNEKLMSNPSIVELPDLYILIHEINPRVTIPIGWWRHLS
jgi:hypothetical protein